MLSGLHPGLGGGAHAGASTKFLTGVPGHMTDGTGIRSGTSIDQLLGQELGRQTQLSSLELGLDSRDFAGSCDAGFACAYTKHHLVADADHAAADGEQPAGRLRSACSGDSGTTDPAIRQARIAEDRSILDSVSGKVDDLQRGLGSSDRRKIAPSTSTPCATSNAASSGPRSRAAGTCRSCSSRPASRRRSTSTCG